MRKLLFLLLLLPFIAEAQDTLSSRGYARTVGGGSDKVPVTRTVNGKALSDNVTIDKTDVGLGNVNNTSDAGKPVSTATQTALDLKQNISGNTGGWTVLRVSGSNATTTGQTLVDITGLNTGTLSNGTLYEIEAVLYVQTSTGTNGTTYGIATGGTGGASEVFAVVQGTTTAAGSGVQTINTAATKTTAYLTAASLSGIVRMNGFVKTRGSGTATISIQHSKETSGTSTVLIGSVFRYRLAQ